MWGDHGPDIEEEEEESERDERREPEDGAPFLDFDPDAEEIWEAVAIYEKERDRC
jgi:hypothetical protein